MSLEDYRYCLPNRCGGWIIGEGVYAWGHELINALEQPNFMQVLIVNATGQTPSDTFCKWMEAAFIGGSWPDPRIWCNTVSSLAGSARARPFPAVLAGLLASDTTLFGTTTVASAMSVFTDMTTRVTSGETFKDIVARYTKASGVIRMPGYARPIAEGDLRVGGMMALDKKLGIEYGEVMLTALQLDSYMQEEHQLSLNFGGYLAAMFADSEYASDDVERMMVAVTIAGITGCYKEDFEKTSRHFLPMRADDVEYSGPAPRELPVR